MAGWVGDAPRSGTWLAIPVAAVGAALFGAAVAGAPELLRPLLTLAVLGVLVALALVRPTAAVPVTVAFLIVVALVRRLLIAESGWSSYDPLLLVGPVIATLLVVQVFAVRRRPLAPDALSRLVVFVLGLTALQVVNPAGGGLGVGLGGFLFVGMPLLWFFVGRELLDARGAAGLLRLVLIAGAAVAAYGLAQSQLGFPVWDTRWLQVNGYVSLNVGDQVRSFGSFSSSAEYALFLGSAASVAVAFLLRGRGYALLALPVITLALFLASARAALVTAFLAIVVLLAVRTRRPGTALIVTVVALAGALAGMQVLGSTIANSARGTGNALVIHQVGGLTDPLNPNESTLLTHVGMVVEGARKGVTSPLGQGTGATNLAAARFGGENQATEVDISNAFVGLGLVGGLAYLAVVLLALAWAVRACFAGIDLALGVLGLLIVGAGQWLIGGHYALAPITWLLVGWLASPGVRAGLRKASDHEAAA